MSEKPELPIDLPEKAIFGADSWQIMKTVNRLIKHCRWQTTKIEELERQFTKEEVYVDKEVTNKPYWCKHIRLNTNLNQYILFTMPTERETLSTNPCEVRFTVMDAWKVCPICGTPRPTSQPYQTIVSGKDGGFEYAVWKPEKQSLENIVIKIMNENPTQCTSIIPGKIVDRIIEEVKEWEMVTGKYELIKRLENLR